MTNRLQGSSGTALRKFGRNPDVGTGAYEDIWGAGGSYNWLQAASAVRVKAGGNAADDTAGAGTQSVTIVGLDENWAEATETIATAGASASSATTTTFIRVSRVYSEAVGTYTGNNTGDIEIETTGGTTVAFIGAGLGQTQQGIYSVPADTYFHISSVFIDWDGQKAGTVRMWQRQNADDVTTPFSAKRLLLEIPILSGEYQGRQDAYIVIPPKSDVWFSALATTSNAECVVDFQGVLEDWG